MMVSDRATSANYFGKYDTPYKRKSVPQNSTGKNAVKTKANKPESRGAKPQNAPAQKQKLPDKAPVPTARPDLGPIFEPGGSMVPPPAPIFEPGGSTVPPPFAPGGSQLAMPATGNTIPSPLPMPTDPRLSMPPPDPRIMPQITGSTDDKQDRLSMRPIAGMNLNIPGQPGADPRLQVLQQRLAGGQNPMWPGWPGV
jgi:hypothetical protein